MAHRGGKRPTILIFGGDGRDHDLRLAGAEVRRFPGPRFAGNGRFRSGLSALETGEANLALGLARWLGHSDARALSRACAVAGVPLLWIPGGLSLVRRAAQAFLAAWKKGDPRIQLCEGASHSFVEPESREWLLEPIGRRTSSCCARNRER